ncbi:hypothetical protein MMC21_000961 [Puttea exsequens]|nr:hypothetical protein [Puttea exsequens]
MDVAYDHIQEEVLDPDALAHKHPPSAPQSPTLQTEFQEAYKSFSASPWGARLGGFFSDVRKQGETYYEGARQEASAASGGALKGFEGLKTKVAEQTKRIGAASASEGAPNEEKDERKERSESEALRESEGVIARFRVEAAKRLKELEKAEEAADAAILKFGANVGNFLREAVTIAPPTEELNQDGTKKVLFESKDQDGKRVIHSTRFEASLHAIHSSLESFAKEPDSPEWEKWKDVFNVEEKTGAIARDLEKYEELRRTMENLVPEKVEYAAFWTRYYFLRMVIETEEQRRREMLKGAANAPTETIAWDDDSDDESTPAQASTPQQRPTTATTDHPTLAPTATSTSSSTTLHQPSSSAPDPATTAATLKPSVESRRSEEGSDASYDLVSGATSRAPGSPKEKEREGRKGEEDEEEDWE